jgi:protein tyrosine phosphatase (PTP) superfamily phosphohydrolase (DUF442 family)
MQLPTWDLTVLIVIVLIPVLIYCLTGGRSSRGYRPSEDIPNVEEIQ